MSEILNNISLKPLNTFGIDVQATSFVKIDSYNHLMQLVQMPVFKEQPHYILGGGSNLLLTQNYNGLMVQIANKGIEVLKETTQHVYVKVQAGEVWHQFVIWCIAQNYAGVENLSLIPGSVGAGPMQNIGAYGVELKDVFFELEALHIPTNTLKTFDAGQCNFGYRQSIFKTELKSQCIILSVTFRLNKQPEFKVSYGAIKEQLELMQIKTLSIKAISDAVISIRKSKLPNPEEIGNAGSFFKNPTISKEQYKMLISNYPDCVGYALPNDEIKLAAGWLIEQCGFKGKRIGNTGAHAKQALVLVNYGGATGAEVFACAQQIQQEVKLKFDVCLDMEVNIL
ncbi:MAG: UDP-N-acetylmuramate dehydrogenase [Bacteroidia bacterium]|nr:UDP-N-acetylmuramate dehydrogenase [Bacteroidia bacterium]HQV00225.1 UDP-N-acetylmuramate dehydrogenase [Bacteroidia bacterium]